MFFHRFPNNGQDLPKASPRVIFTWKNLISRIWLKHWSFCPNEGKVKKVECHHAPICALTCRHVQTSQFVSCAENDSLCGEAMIYDGLNLRCVDQCHGVRSKAPTKAWPTFPTKWRTINWVQCAKMWQDCSLAAVHRNAAFVEQWCFTNLIYAGLPRKPFPQK